MRPIVLVLLLLPLTLAGCESSPEPEPAPPPAEEAPPPPEPPPDRFSSERAWRDLEALVEIGPRVPGTEGSERARAYIVGELRKTGASVGVIETRRSLEGQDDVTLHHVSAVLPGASPRVLMLVAPYDSSHFGSFEFVGANDGASGAALLLELGRVLSHRSLPYTTRLLFLDGEGRADGDAEGPATERWHGSRSVAEQLDESGELEQIRVLVAFHQVCDADLQIARDLHSHRMHREEFFRAARRLNLSDPFPTDRGFESLESSHRAFRERGVRGAVALVDTRHGGDMVPGALAESADDTLEHCSQESLGAVGVVALEALDTITRRLAKIDRFTRTPLAGVESEAAEASEPAGEPDAVDAAQTPTGNEPAVPSQEPSPGQ